jgi:hypothetical protein
LSGEDSGKIDGEWPVYLTYFDKDLTFWMSNSNRYDLVRRGIPSTVNKDKIFPKNINILIKCVPFVSEESVEKVLDVDSKNISSLPNFVFEEIIRRGHIF